MSSRRILGLFVLTGLLVTATTGLADDPSVEITDVTPVGCVGCNSGLLPAVPSPFIGGTPGGPPCACGTGPGCVPGQKPCYPCTSDTHVGRFICGLYECICCPDPCYDPKWYPLADSAFYAGAVRPVTQQRFRFDSGQNLILPDRSEFFWARADGKGKGPKPKAPLLGERGLRYNDLRLITEGGTATASLIVDTPYRSMQPIDAGHAAGFGDIGLGPKTLLFDCELLQIAMQFLTYVPSGNFTKGLGTGHVSLEPSLLVGLKLTQTTYLQTQLSEWIPLGGDPNYSGAILHTHVSLNQELCRILPDVPLIATGEIDTWSFQDGLYTDPFLGPQKSSGTTYAYLGGGLRLFVCDKIDFGFAGSFAVSQQHFARELYTMEFRVRY